MTSIKNVVNASIPLPCPFCGGAPEVERYGTARQTCVVVCQDCGCTLESNEQGAFWLWNKRIINAK